MNQMIANIALSGVPFHVDKLYSYAIPDALKEKSCPGIRVIVPFGRSNRRTEGLIFSVSAASSIDKMKSVMEILDDQSLVSDSFLRLIQWMKARYFCTYYDALKTILPSGVWLHYNETIRLLPDADPAIFASLSQKNETDRILLEALSHGELPREKLEQIGGEQSTKRMAYLLSKKVIESEMTAVRKLSDKSIKMVSLSVSAEDALAAVVGKQKSAPLRYAAVQMLCQEGKLTSADLCYYTGASLSTLRGLEKAGIISFSEQEILRVPKLPEKRDTKPIVLNSEQQVAYEGILSLVEAGKPDVVLLHGITASGKTLVYLKLIEQTLAMGNNAMLLVPEIALTPQMMARFSARFGDKVAMLHSALCVSERYDQWKRIRRGEVRVVLGTRSAIFAPLERLSLIILDEEQEGTYQSENPPRYHTRDIAQFRCSQSNAILLLGSATPTVETKYYANCSRYKVFYLYRRFNDKCLPRVIISDLRQELAEGNESSIGKQLAGEIEKNLENGEQTILFLNRRGNSRMLLCMECGQTPECPRCSVPMTYHSANARLMCHYCGHSEPVFERCKYCGGILKHIGTGTQKVEEELASRFPGVRMLRMDVDTVGASHSHQKLLETFDREKVPILLGTQMIAKGLDFENVTLVGVLSADQALYADHFRAAERTFCLLSQVVGRAGRGSKQGRAVIQTFTPQNEIIRASAAQDYDAFFASEIRMRRLRRYPPFSDLFTLTVTGADEQQVHRSCKTLCDALRLAAKASELHDMMPEVLGPAPARIVKVNNRFRYHIYIAAPNTAAIRNLVRDFLLAFPRHRENRGLDIFANCNALT